MMKQIIMWIDKKLFFFCYVHQHILNSHLFFCYPFIITLYHLHHLTVMDIHHHIKLFIFTRLKKSILMKIFLTLLSLFFINYINWLLAKAASFDATLKYILFSFGKAKNHIILLSNYNPIRIYSIFLFSSLSLAYEQKKWNRKLIL